MDPPVDVLPAVPVRMVVAPALVTMGFSMMHLAMAPATVTMAPVGAVPSTMMTPRPLLHPPRRADGGRVGPAQTGGRVDADAGEGVHLADQEDAPVACRPRTSVMRVGLPPGSNSHCGIRHHGTGDHCEHRDRDGHNQRQGKQADPAFGAVLVQHEPPLEIVSFSTS